MLSGKHANIGNTVGMLKDIHKISKDPEIANEITLMFIEEARSCDYGENSICTFPRLPELADDNTKTHACMIGRCPLGAMFDAESKARPEFGGDPEVDRMQLYGKNTMGYGSHIHIGYTGWRKYWNMFKNDTRKYWQAYTLTIVVVGIVWAASASAGHLSIYLW